MKNWIIRIADPVPFGLTRRDAMTRAIVAASFVNSPSGGRVDTVFTRALHFFTATGDSGGHG